MGIEKQPSHRRALAPGQVEGFNRAMKHGLLIVALAALAACASPQAQPVESGGLAIGHDLDCNAGDVVNAQGEASTLYISLSIPDGGGEGRFCIATGCEDAEFIPAASTTGGYAATMRTNDRTQYNARVEIGRDLRSFTLRDGTASQGDTWTGTCNAAGS